MQDATANQTKRRRELDLQVEDDIFRLEAIFAKVDAQRKQEQDARNLATVAAMMDEWTRLENMGYAECNKALRKNLDEARVHESTLIAANNQMAGIILELEAYLDEVRPNRTRLHTIRQLDNGVLMPITHIFPEIVDLTTDEEVTEEEEELEARDHLMTQLMDM